MTKTPFFRALNYMLNFLIFTYIINKAKELQKYELFHIKNLKLKTFPVKQLEKMWLTGKNTHLGEFFICFHMFPYCLIWVPVFFQNTCINHYSFCHIQGNAEISVYCTGTLLVSL